MKIFKPIVFAALCVCLAQQVQGNYRAELSSRRHLRESKIRAQIHQNDDQFEMRLLQEATHENHGEAKNTGENLFLYNDNTENSGTKETLVGGSKTDLEDIETVGGANVNEITVNGDSDTSGIVNSSASTGILPDTSVDGDIIKISATVDTDPIVDENTKVTSDLNTKEITTNEDSNTFDIINSSDSTAVLPDTSVDGDVATTTATVDTDAAANKITIENDIPQDNSSTDIQHN